MKYKAFVFDFDYTLGDSTEGIIICINYALEQMGHSPSEREQIRYTIGLSLEKTYFTLTGDSDTANGAHFKALFKQMSEQVMVANSHLLPHALETLSALKAAGFKTGIVTTKYHRRIEQILDKFNIRPLIDLVVGGDDVKHEKPDPEGLLYAADILAQNKHEVLYIGDSLVDAKTALNSGIDFAAVTTGTTSGEEFLPYPHVMILKNLESMMDREEVHIVR